MADMLDIVSFELLNIGIFVILAISLTVINGFTGMFSLGHAAFFGAGAYAAALYMNAATTYIYSASPELHSATAHWTLFPAGMYLAVLAAGLLGLCVAIPCLRLAGDYLAIATLAFGEIFKIFLESFRPDIFGGSMGLRLRVDELDSHWAFLVILAAIVLTATIARNIKNSATGRAFLAIRENDIAAQVMGVNTARLKIQAFVIGSALAGLAGALFAYSRHSISPKDFDLMRTIMILLMIVLGGTGSVSGAIVGALLLGAVEALVRYLPEIGLLVSENETLYNALSKAQENPQVIFALMLIVLIRLRPHGIFGMGELTDLFKKHPGDDKEETT